MLLEGLSLSKTLNPPFSLLHLHHHPSLSNPLSLKTAFFKPPKPLHSPITCFAGKSKKKATSGGRLEGGAELRREIRRNARRKSKKLAESLFYRLKNPHKNYPDNFSEDELQEIGLGYDRLVRFMAKDDPNLRHPYDWYKYGEFGPYSWRGVVVGDPVRGRFSDERVAMISQVRDHEEWEKIEQFEMGHRFGSRLERMDRTKFRYFWVFVRHPRWRVSELPWEQWTLVSEVVLEAGKQRLDKWSLMGRLGSVTRSLITKCAAWMRPDIIYVKKPVYQCRFEPQDNFFKALMPFLDPKTERNYLFELENDDGGIELVTYFGGLCKICKVSPKVFVDDVVKGYDKLSDEKKLKCLGFLLKNHPVHLLHPYTKEWKVKLEELELGCDAPDEDDGRRVGSGEAGEFVDWIEEDDENEVLDMEDGGIEKEDLGEDDDHGKEEEFTEEEEEEEEEEDDEDDEDDDPDHWEKEFEKAVNSADSEAMERLVKRSVEVSTEHYKQQLKQMGRENEKEKVRNSGDEEQYKQQKRTMRRENAMEKRESINEDGDETQLRGKWAKVSPEEWKIVGVGPWRKKIKKSKIPPELFLRAAVRPFTYRHLVKEIVLTRHAIVDGDISPGDKIL